MVRIKSAALVVLAMSLAMAGGIGAAPRAYAAPVLEIAAGSQGSDYFGSTLIVIRNCTDRTVYSGATYTITDSNGVAISGAAENSYLEDGTLDVRQISVLLKAGFYTVEVTCLLYDVVEDIPPVLTVTQTFLVPDEVMRVAAGDPNKGGQVTLSSVGRLAAGEQVKLELIDETEQTLERNARSSVPVAGKVVKTWATTAVVDSHTIWEYTVDLPTPEPKRAYRLKATGLTSGEVVTYDFGDWSEKKGGGGLPPTGD